ncbi:MFS transporter [Tenggerimyces flavus]|uniref:MFS transporter n=1 Tax=Tenggerimyces flavus TaxID=1708749 RepID=A0ABV7Y6E9_9ACTN|nr:MFS transporter [Tenggerimyces flavus]MBM7785287.1 MFS family permease [Tenggerimyces flavus]
MTSTPSLATAQTSATSLDRAAPWLALPVILLGTFMAVSNFFVVNIALPAIGHSLQTNNAMLQLITAAYSVTYAATLVAGGRLGDRFGRRRLFAIGAIAFALASAACGFAFDGWTLAIGRLVQGIAAGLMAPQVLGSVQAIFTGEHRQRALGYYGAAIGLACVLGQMLGGGAVALDEAFGWRAVFELYAVLGLLVALMAVRFVPETRGVARPVDGRGALLLTLTLALLLVPLSVGPGAGWPLWCVVALVAMPFVGVWFVLDQRGRERRGGHPLLPPSLFELVAFRRGLATLLMFCVGVGGFFLTIGLSLQDGLGFTALSAAGALGPYAVGFLIASLAAPRLVARYGGRAIVAGALLTAVTFAAVTVQALLGYGELSWLTLAPTLVPLGLGQGLAMVPIIGAVLAQIPVDRAGFASGVLATTQQAGFAVGVGLLGLLFFQFASGPVGAPGWKTATVAVLAAEAVLGLATAAFAYFATVRRSR